ncbi:MAG: hypothetical protein ACE5GF_10145 [Thermodesulfobacteriota bacterium]
MDKEKKEIMELSHDPVPGYKPAFYIIFAIFVIYLAVIFARTL